MEQPEIIYAEKKTVQLMGCLIIDSYRMPSGEYRFDLKTVSIALGYGHQWLSQILTRKGKSYKALIGKGFSDTQLEVKSTKVGRTGGTSRALTIGVKDFQATLKYAASEKNPIAIAYLESSSERSTIDDLREAWGENRLTLDERRRIYCEELAKSFTAQEWAETSGAGAVFDWGKAKDPEWLMMMFSNDWQPSMLLMGIDMDQYAEEWEIKQQAEVEL